MKKENIELDYNVVLDLKFIEKVGSPFDCDFPILGTERKVATIANKKILVIRLESCAELYALNNTVTYVTDNKEKYDQFLEKVNNEKYGSDNTAILFNDWKNIDKLLEENDMKFDVCIMNPPYNKTLHLQIIEKVLKVCDKTVNISPAGWLLDLPAVMSIKKTTYQRFENTISRHIVSLNLLTASEASAIFDAAFFQNVGIYYIDKTIESDVYSRIVFMTSLKVKSIFDKTIMKVYNKEIDNLYSHIKISTIHGNPGTKKEFDVVTPQYRLIKKLKPVSMTDQEFKNWHQSCNTKFMKYCNYLTRNGQHVAAHLLPFMNDYSHEWSDEMFYDYFKLSEDEIETLEQFGRMYT